MGFSVSWQSYLPTPDGFGNFTVSTTDLSFLDFGAQYGDDPGRLNPPKHVVGLRFQGTAAYNIRVWLASTRAEIMPAVTRKPIPRLDTKAVAGSPLRHPNHVLAGETISFSAAIDTLPADASITPYQITLNNSAITTPAAWNPTILADSPSSPGATITLTPPVGTANGPGQVWARDLSTGAIYLSPFEVVDSLFRFRACRATDATTYAAPASAWPALSEAEIGSVSLMNAPLNKAFEAFSQPLGIAVVAPAVINAAYPDITIENMRLLAAFDTYDQPH